MAQQESQPYDRALKSLFGDEAAEILPRLVEGVELIDEQNIEIDRPTLTIYTNFAEIKNTSRTGETNHVRQSWRIR